MSSPVTQHRQHISPSQQPASPSSRLGRNEEQQATADAAHQLQQANEAAAMRLVDAAGDCNDYCSDGDGVVGSGGDDGAMMVMPLTRRCRIESRRGIHRGHHLPRIVI
jgi:hypothetical protein